MAAMVASAAETTMYGPGYVNNETLEGGIGRFVDQHGPFDALILGPNVPVMQADNTWDPSLRYHQRYAALASSPKVSKPYLKDLFDCITGLPIPTKVACLTTLDYYGTIRDQIDRIDNLGLMIMGANEDFAPRLADMPEWASQEEHFVRKASRLSDAWADFVSSNPSRVITSLHFIAEDEFCFRALEARNERISVPGVAYAQRTQGSRALRNAGIRPQSRLVFNMYRLANRIGLPVYSSYTPLRLFNASYVGGLINTRFVYTARGGFGLPVRKFFEIPAAGAMMICSPPLGFRELGFVSEVNYVEAEPNAVPEVVAMYEQDLERAQDIAKEGRDLVWSRHSLSARAKQLRTCLDAAKRGSYAGARWIDGEFVLQ